MSENKYKNKINKEKKKCNELINKLYGDNYYFIHETSKTEIEDILKSGKIKIGTHIDNNISDPVPYAYFNIEFDDVPLQTSPIIHYLLVLHPRILFDNGTVIYNKQWPKYPDSNSIYINKEDTNDIKKQKIKEIKNKLIEFQKENPKYYYKSTHEILFTSDIELKDNLIGIIYNNNLYVNNPYYKYYKGNKNMFFNYTPIIKKLLKKYEYNNVKLYNEIPEFPLLCDLLI